MPGQTCKRTNLPQPPRGQSLLEFVIVLPILLLVILGAMDFARLFTTKIVLTNAAREGASYLSNHPADFANAYAAITAEVQEIELDSKNITCSAMVDGRCERGATITATVMKEMDLIFGGFLQAMGVASGPFQLTSTVRMMTR